MKIRDISVPVYTKIPLWPGVASPRFKKNKSIGKGDDVNDTSLEMNLHTGTHVDAPRHFSGTGKSIDQLPLETFIGPAFVAHLPRVKKITAKDLDTLRLPPGVTRLLFRTSNSLLWTKKTLRFKKEYVGLTTDAARWLVQHHIKLVGVDYVSVATFDEAAPVHKILLSKNVVLLEGINLAGVKQGTYQLICLPVNISDAEASPVRAILLKP